MGEAKGAPTYCAQTLSPYTALNTLSSSTVPIHCTQYTVLIHRPHTPSPYTVLIHCTHTLHSLHCPHTLYSYTVLIHRPHTPSSYTVLIHCPHTPSSYTVPIHCPHTPPSYTVLIKGGGDSLSEVGGVHPADNFSLVSLSSPKISFIICVEPEVKVLFKWQRPADIGPDDAGI
jgi:hypothetical protein